MMRNPIDAFEESRDPFSKRFSCYGIRRQEPEFESEGDVMAHTSSVWEDGEETDEELDGVSALCLDRFKNLDEAIEASKVYFGSHLAIIASDGYTWGQDEDEVVLEDPVIICVIS